MADQNSPSSSPNKNPYSGFFQRLTRLFRSGTTIRRKVKGYDYRNQFERQVAMANQGWRGGVTPFGQHAVGYNALGQYGQADRFARYQEFVEAESVPEVASALTVLSHETCACDENGKSFHVFTDNPEVRKALDELFNDVCNIEYNLHFWVRNMLKYGDMWLYHEVMPDYGVINIMPLPPVQVEREEGYDKNDPYAVRFRWQGGSSRYLENWQVSHFRMLGNDQFYPYGSSLLDPARRIIRSLIMAEDAMLTYRIARAPERLVFYIDTAGIPPNDVPSYMGRAQAALKSNIVVDKQTGRLDYRNNPMSILDNFYIPIRGGNFTTKVESIAGGQNVSAVEDVEYLQNKLFSALQVPKSYLNFGEDLCLHGDTKVSLLDGTTPTIQDLAEKFRVARKEGWSLTGEVWTRSWDTETQRFVPGKVLDCWETKKVDELYEVVLDSGDVVRCTGNHPWLLRDGKTYRRADELQSGDSLLPIYTKTSSKKEGDELEGYTQVWDPNRKVWEYEHRLVNSWTAQEEGGHKVGRTRVIHHKNFNKRNNNPGNLQEMTWLDHRRLHSENLETSMLSPEGRRKSLLARLPRLKSKEHRDFKRELLSRERSTPGTKMYKYWHSEETSELRKQHLKTRWQTPEFREKMIRNSRAMGSNPRFIQNHPQGETHWARKATRQYDLEWLVQFCLENPVAEYRWFKYPAKFGPGDLPVSTRVLQRIFRENNISGWRGLQKLVQEKRQPAPNNHKVLEVRVLRCNNTPVFDLAIEKYANFAVGSVVVHNSSKATLSLLDVRVSRTISVIQKVIIGELNKLAMIHLYAKGFDGEDLVDFDLRLSNPSTIAMQQKLELWAAKMNIAGTSKEVSVVDEEWIQKNILGLTNDEISKMLNGRRRDKAFAAELESITPPQTPPEAPEPSRADLFAQGSYEVPGAGIPKEPADNDHPAGVDSQEPHKPLFQSVSDLATLPVKPSGFMARHNKNVSRHRGYKGAYAQANPDHSAMLSPGRLNTTWDSGVTKMGRTVGEGVNPSLEELAGGESLNNVLTLAEIRELLHPPKALITKEVRSMFGCFDAKTGGSTSKKRTLMEEDETVVLDTDQIMVLDEAVTLTPEERVERDISALLEKKDDEDPWS